MKLPPSQELVSETKSKQNGSNQRSNKAKNPNRPSIPSRKQDQNRQKAKHQSLSRSVSSISLFQHQSGSCTCIPVVNWSQQSDLFLSFAHSNVSQLPNARSSAFLFSLWDRVSAVSPSRCVGTTSWLAPISCLRASPSLCPVLHLLFKRRRSLGWQGTILHPALRSRGHTCHLVEGALHAAPSSP